MANPTISVRQILGFAINEDPRNLQAVAHRGFRRNQVD
jgi:hypothetical protein